MERAQIEDLLKRYHKRQTTAEENAWIESWYVAQGNKLPAFTGEIDYEAKKQQIWDSIGKLKTKTLRTPIRLWPRIAAAASIVLIMSVGGYFLFRNPIPTRTVVAAQQDIAPGRAKAFLTLADGRKIDLDAAAKGSIASQPGITITKSGNGTLIYSIHFNAGAGRGFNTIQTPKGGEYQVVLPDGSHVWLNAASSLKYPVSFGDGERRVTLSGEAYFEIAHDRSRPFRVISGSQTVEVLGTHFNIMAYNDEAIIRTTLLQGSVKINDGETSKMLKPGEDALVKDGIKIRQADTELAVAWKNGRTYFKDADIPTMMRSLSRWYNIEIAYRGAIPKRLFTGSIPRTSKLSALLKILEAMNIHTEVKDRKLTVTP